MATAHPRKFKFFTSRSEKKKSCSLSEEENAIECDTLCSPQPNVLKYTAVVAIDFGTTYSGYAYAFTSDPNRQVHVMRNCHGQNSSACIIGGQGQTLQKQPTVLLLTDNGQFHSFGYEAQQYYHDIDEYETEQWLYFEKFKMELHSRKHLHEGMQLIAANGHRLPAVLIFTHSLRYFRELCLNELNQQLVTPITEHDVQWVITVPAIWRESAKQFMRKAAFDAGLIETHNSDQLTIALEPEAASIYCRSLQLNSSPNPRGDVTSPTAAPGSSPLYSPLTHQPATLSCSTSLSSSSSSSGVVMTPDSLDSSTNSNYSTIASYHRQIKQAAKLHEGVRYIVADCGGGTVDLTLHQIQRSGKLKELYKASGGAWGSIGIDYHFEMLLVSIFGMSFIEQFIKFYPISWLELMRSFEARKRCFDPYRECASNIPLPFSFVEAFRRTQKRTVEQAINKYGDRSVQWSTQGNLRLLPRAMNSLFEPVVESVTKHIHKVLSYPSAKDVKYLFMVGGFSESPVLQEAILNEFGGLCQVVIPRDVGLCTIKGAVIFGLDNTIVQIRNAALTYGVGCLHSFNDKVHPLHKKVIKGDGKEWCTDIFDTFVTVNQPISLGKKITRYYNPACNGLRSTVITVFASENEYNTFVTDPGVTKIAELKLQMPPSTDPSTTTATKAVTSRELKVTMDFSTTEVSVTAVDCTTGHTASVNIDFLYN